MPIRALLPWGSPDVKYCAEIHPVEVHAIANSKSIRPNRMLNQCQYGGDVRAAAIDSQADENGDHRRSVTIAWLSQS